MVVCTMQNYPRDEQLKLVQATQVQTTAGIVDNGNGAEEDEDREEGEIVDEFEMIISSEDEEFKLRARIQQLEDKSKDIEKMDMLAANLANQYSYQRPPGLERYTGPKYQHFSPISILSDVSSLSEEELKFEPPKKTRKHRTKRTESKRHNPSANIRRNPYASHQHMTRSRKKRRHENHHHHCNINNNNHQSSILLNALDSVTDDEICEYDMNVENENDEYAERLKLSRNKLRMALARSGNYDIKPKHSLRERLQCRMPKTSPSPDRKLIRADAELPANSFDGYGNLEPEEREQEQDPDADLEEPEIRLRLIALKSAMLKKHMARKKRDAERAYSPTDMINRVHPPKISDDIDDFMEISPAASPERPPVHSPPPPPPPEPVDMDLAQTDSEEDNAKKEWSQPFNSLANSGGSWRCFMPNPLLPPVSMPISIVIDDDDTEEEELQQQQQQQLQQNNIDDEDELPPPAPSYHIPQLDDDDARDALSLLHTEQQHNQDTLSDIQSISMDNSQTQTQTSRPFHNESSDDEAAALRALLLAGLKPAPAVPSAVAKPLPTALSTVKEEETIGHDSDDPEELRQLLLTSIASKKKSGDELPADSPVILLNAVRRFKTTTFEQEQKSPPMPEDSAQSLLNVPLPYLERQPVPAPVFELVPEPVPAPVPAPIAALVPEPVPAPVFERVPEPVPAPVPASVFEFVPAPVPAPIAALVPEPVPAPVCEPVPAPVPAPVCEPLSVPAPEPVPAPIAEPLPVPAPEPAALATLSLPLRVPSPQEVVEAPKSSSSSSIIKIVKPNKVINKKRKVAKLHESEPVIKRPATLLVKEPVAPLHHGQNGNGFSSSTRLITALDPSSIKANKLIIALAAESSAGSDDDLSESYCYNNFTSYADNASPFSPLVDSASNSTTRSNTPNSEVVEPNNPNLRRTIMNEYFEKKLDDYLKNARSLVPTTQLTESIATEAKLELEVEKETQLPKPKADKAAATSPKAKATPVAVRHLPVASQREYLRLIERMQLLEKKKIGANKSTTTTKTTTAAVRSTTTTTATVVGAGAVKEATTTVAAAVKATTKTAAAAVKETKKATTTVAAAVKTTTIAAAVKEATTTVAAVKATTTTVAAAVKATTKATTIAAAVKEAKTIPTTTVAAAVKETKKATTTVAAAVKETSKVITSVAATEKLTTTSTTAIPAPEKLFTTATTAIKQASPSKKVIAAAKKQVLKKVTLRAGTQVNNKPDATEQPSTSIAAAAAATLAAAATSATQPTKESRLKAFESSFHKIGCSMISNLDKSLQLVDEARKSKITRLRHAHRLKELYAEMQTIKQAVQLEEKKLKRIQPEIQTSHEIIISLKQKRNKLRKAALDLGNGLKGDDYRYYNNKNNNKNNKRQEQQMDKQRSILQIHDSWDRQQMCLTKGRVGNFTQPLQYYTTVEFICRLLDPGKTEITRKYTQLTKDIRLYNSIVKYEHIPEEVPVEIVAEQKQDCDSQQPEQPESSSNCDSQASASPAENEILKTECDKPEAEVRQKEEAKTTLEFVDTQPEIVPPPPFMRELTELPATKSPLEAYRTPMSRNYNSQLNVHATICPFELMGRCEDTDCSYLHLPRPSPPTTRSKQ